MPSPVPLASRGRLIAYAVANTGGVIAYLPLLTLLLPGKVARIAGAARLDVLTACVIAGAIAASASNVLFGWLSDRSVARGRSRRGWIMVGLALTAAGLANVALARSAVALVAAIALFQVAVNALLSPLLASMADEIPDAQKGVASGMLALAAPVAAGASALLVAAPALGEGGRLAAVMMLTALCVVPLAAMRAAPLAPAPPPENRHGWRHDAGAIWAARMLVQCAGSALSLYLIYYFESVVRDVPAGVLTARVGGLLTLAYTLPLPLAVMIGRWSDRTGRRRPFIAAAAVIAAAGLAIMAAADGWASAGTGFVTYAVGSATFLALLAGFAMQLLPDPARRGRHLGLLNLSNTLPALVAPLLTWWLATPEDFGAVMLALAGLTLAGGAAMLAVRRG